MILPIVIITTPRTGSTVYAKHLAEKYNVRFLNEPYDPNIRTIEHSEKELLNCFGSNENYVAKIMITQLSDMNPTINLVNRAKTKIFLFRKNVIDQIASFYIASSRNWFNTRHTDKIEEYIVPIDTDKLLHSIHFITNNVYLLNVLYQNKDANIRIDYEDVLNMKLIDKKWTYTKQPINLNEIKDAIRLLLKRINKTYGSLA